MVSIQRMNVDIPRVNLNARVGHPNARNLSEGPSDKGEERAQSANPYTHINNNEVKGREGIAEINGWHND